MAKILSFMQGKGGCGKSLSCILTAQYLIDTGRKAPICIDVDPVNATFAAYSAFNAHRINILDKNKRINQREFDKILDIIIKTQEDDVVIIDNGASSFIGFSDFMLSNKIPSLLKSMGHELYINTLITGGNSQADTISGFVSLVAHFGEESKIVAWLNPYYGSVEHEGKGFESFKSYKENQSKITGIITLPDFQSETFGFDFGEMLKYHLTFKEALEHPSFSFMAKQRLKIIQEKFYEQIALCPEL